MTGLNYILHKVEKCATIGARQMWRHTTKDLLARCFHRGKPRTCLHTESNSPRGFVFWGRCFSDGSCMAGAIPPVLSRLEAMSTSERNPAAVTQAPFFCRRVTRDTQPGLHGLTRQTTPSRDTPRVVRPALAQGLVMLLATQVETRPVDKANGPSCALGFFAATLGPSALIALNSGAREAIEPRSIHPRYRYACGVFA